MHIYCNIHLCVCCLKSLHSLYSEIHLHVCNAQNQIGIQKAGKECGSQVIGEESIRLIDMESNESLIMRQASAPGENERLVEENVKE